MSRISASPRGTKRRAKAITDLERRVQRRRRGEAERDLLRADPRRTGGRARQQRERPERLPGHGHPLPELTRAARGTSRRTPPGPRPGRLPMRRRGPCAASRLVRRAPVPLTHRATSRGRARARAASRTRGAAAPSAGRSSRSPAPGRMRPSSADRMTWARNGSDRMASIDQAGSAPAMTEMARAMYAPRTRAT